jgi:hypothetical protein
VPDSAAGPVLARIFKAPLHQQPFGTTAAISSFSATCLPTGGRLHRDRRTAAADRTPAIGITACSPGL